MKQLKKGLRVCLLILLAISLSFGVSTKSEAAKAQKVSKVKFSSSKYTIVKGKKKTLTVSISPSSAKKKKVNFKSSNNSIISIKRKANNKIEVTAKKAGTAKITATVSGTKVKATCKITVKNPKVAAKKVKISPSSYTMYVAYKKTLKATVSPSNTTYKKVTWSSSNTKVATVDSKGKVTAKKAGTAVITAKVKSTKVKATCKITVKNPTVKLNSTSKTLYVNDVETLKATVTPSSEKVTWSSSDTKVASVNSKGKVTAKKAGSATITVKIKDKNIKAVCKIKVKNVAAKEVTLSDTALSLYTGEARKLTYTISPANATNTKVTWSCDKTSVAVVSTAGKVTAKKVGSATITVKVDGTDIQATCKVTVKDRTATESEIAGKFYHTWKCAEHAIENKITKTHMFINNESQGNKYTISSAIVNADKSMSIYVVIQEPVKQYALFKVSADGNTMEASYSHDNGKTYSDKLIFKKVK